MLGEIIGPDIAIIGLLVLVLFGGSQLPKLARSLGSAKKEFERGLQGDADDKSDDPSDDKSKAKTDAKPDAKTDAPEAAAESDATPQS